MKYSIGQYIEPMDNSFIAEKTKTNEAGIIVKDGTMLSKLMFSDYYTTEPGEERARFVIVNIEKRQWMNYSCLEDKHVWTYPTLTVRSSVTSKEYYIGIWREDYAPRIM